MPSPVDTLDTGRQRTDTGSPITVYFVPNGVSRDGVRSEGWTAYEIQRFEAALAAIAAVTNVTFRTTTDPDADMQLVLSDDGDFRDPGYLGYFYLPLGSLPSVGAFNSQGYGWDQDGLQEGGLGFSTIIHEVLHGLGLDHPHEGDFVLPGLNPFRPGFPFEDYGDYGLNQGVYTIMSYNAGLNTADSNSFDYGDSYTPMALDIAALQELYGANMSTATGNDVYEIPDGAGAGSGTGWASIWDAGGTDEMRYFGGRDVTIDLRAATLQYEEGGGGFISRADGISGGYTIANGVQIENATGSSGDDMLIGNAANNVLTGNGGRDMLYGHDGNDTLWGGGASDQLYGGHGQDRLEGGDNNDTLRGQTGDDDLNGGSGGDMLYGDSGRDSLAGGSGVNTLYGGSGADTIIGGGNRDTAYGGAGDDLINTSGGDDTIFGGRGADTINAGAGADTITGGLGADVMDAGAGDGNVDTFIFTALSDSLAGNGDLITGFEVGTDLIDISLIDADLATAGNQGFASGQVRLEIAGGNMFVQIDRNGDAVTDMEFTVVGATMLSAADFTAGSLDDTFAFA